MNALNTWGRMRWRSSGARSCMGPQPGFARTESSARRAPCPTGKLVGKFVVLNKGSDTLRKSSARGNQVAGKKRKAGQLSAAPTLTPRAKTKRR